MRWEEVGEGPPVVFVHGIPTSPRLWRRVVPLVSGARCLAWEMVGYGASIPEGRDRDISVARQAGYLADWMREVGLAEGAVIVGHDLGGGVAQILAANDPSLVRGLVLTNSICYDSWPVAPVKAIRALGPVLARLPEAAFRLIYGGFMLAGHDERAVARESTAEHLPYYAGSKSERKECGEIMEKVHDMGGRREKFGPIDRSDHEVEDWERLADAVNYVLNAKGHKTTDEMRRAIESLENYREMSYYERWAAAAEMLVVEKGLLTQEEIDERAAALESRWGAG